MVMSIYDNMGNLTWRRMLIGQYITTQPLVRSGEIIGVADGKTSV